MYKVDRQTWGLVVTGPGNYTKTLNPDSISIVVRRSLDWPYGEPVAYAVRCGDMTDAEAVGQALEIDAYPV